MIAPDFKLRSRVAMAARLLPGVRCSTLNTVYRLPSNWITIPGRSCVAFTISLTPRILVEPQIASAGHNEQVTLSGARLRRVLLRQAVPGCGTEARAASHLRSARPGANT